MQIHDILVFLAFLPTLILPAGKLVLALIMFAMGILCLFVLRHSAQLHEQLIALEAECDLARDTVMIQATIMRSQLAEVHERLTTKQEKAEFEVVGNLIKQAMPLVTLLMAKETSLVKWGFAGVKLARSAFEYFSRQGKN